MFTIKKTKVTSSELEALVRQSDLSGYEMIEFSFGGMKGFNFLQLPRSILSGLFETNVLNSTMYCGTSAGSIYLGLTLLSMMGVDVNHVVDYSRRLVEGGRVDIVNVGLCQRRLFDYMEKNLPSHVLGLTVEDVATGLRMGFYPCFLYFDIVRRSLKESDRKTNFLKAMQKSSDVLGMKDGGYFWYIGNKKKIDCNKRSLVIAVDTDYESLSDNSPDYIIINDGGRRSK